MLRGSVRGEAPHPPSMRCCNTSSRQRIGPSFQSCVTVPRSGPVTVTCLNVVALSHYLDIIDVFEMMSALQSVRKRGRPPTREKAPERDRDVEDGVKSVKPAARWRKQLTRHSECLTIFAYDARAYEKKNRTV
jgi:hypothetical protein